MSNWMIPAQPVWVVSARGNQSTDKPEVIFAHNMIYPTVLSNKPM